MGRSTLTIIQAPESSWQSAASITFKLNMVSNSGDGGFPWSAAGQLLPFANGSFRTAELLRNRGHATGASA